MDEAEKMVMYEFMRDVLRLLIQLAHPPAGDPSRETERCLEIEAQFHREQAMEAKSILMNKRVR